MADFAFPLARVLCACPALQCLHLTITEDNPPRLEVISDHASQLTELIMYGIDRFDSVHRILKRLPSLEHFSVMVSLEFVDVFPADKIFEDVAHPERRLRSLDVGALPYSEHLFSALKLCQDIRLRDLTLCTGDVPVTSVFT